MNNGGVFVPIFLVCIVAGCHAYTAHEIYGSLNDEDRGHFLRYYLAKGFLDSQPTDSSAFPGINFPNDLDIPHDCVKTFEDSNIEPKNFSISFLNGFTKKFNVTPSEAFQVAKAKCECVPKDKYICLPNGKCINNGDVGSICCT